MLAIVADKRRDIDSLLKNERFRQTDREDDLRFYTSSGIPNVVAAAGGFGEDSAAQSVGALVRRFNPEIVVSAGFASAGAPGLRTGDIVVCDRILATDGPAYAWRASGSPEIETDRAAIEEIHQWLSASDVNFEIGGCVALPHLATKPPMKEWLGRTFDALAMDINSYRVAEAVLATRRPCIPVRVVIDPMEREISEPVFEILRRPMPLRFTQSARHVRANPIRLFQVIKLATQARRSRKSLARFLHRLVRTRIAMERT